MQPKLFVYGTLLAVAEHAMGALLRQNGALIGPGHIQARLYMIDDPDAPGENSYPGALPSPDPADRVHGELYEVHNPKTVFDAFDDFEACSARWPEPHEFLRRPVTVTMVDGTDLPATSYLYTWDISTATPIPSGRFTQVAPDVR